MVRALPRSNSVPVVQNRASVGSQASTQTPSVTSPPRPRSSASNDVLSSSDMSSETLEGLMEFESIFSEVREAEEKKRRQLQQNHSHQAAPQQHHQVQPEMKTKQGNAVAAVRVRAPIAAPPTQQQASTTVSAMNKTIVNVKLPDETKLKDIPDDSQVTLNVHNGNTIQPIRLLGAVLKQEVLRNNPGLANGTHTGPLVLSVLMTVPGPARPAAPPPPSILTPAAPQPPPPPSQAVSSVPVQPVPSSASSTQVSTAAQQPPPPAAVINSPAPPPPPPAPALVKSTSMGAQTTPVTTSTSVGTQALSPALTVPIVVKETNVGVSSRPVQRSSSQSPQLPPPPPPSAVKSAAVVAAAAAATKPVVTPNKDDPEVVKKVHQILESYQEQVRMSPEEQFKPAPRRNSFPKDSAFKDSSTGLPTPSTAGCKKKKSSVAGNGMASNGAATSPAALSSTSETSERAPSVASDSNLSSDGYHLAGLSPTPSIGSSLDAATVEQSLEAQRLQQQQQQQQQAVSRSTSPQIPAIKQDPDGLKPPTNCILMSADSQSQHQYQACLTPVSHTGVLVATTSSSVLSRAQYIAIQSGSAPRPGGTVVLVQSKNSPNLQALLAGKVAVTDRTRVTSHLSAGTTTTTTTVSPSLEELLSRPPLPIAKPVVPADAQRLAKSRPQAPLQRRPSSGAALPGGMNVLRSPAKKFMLVTSQGSQASGEVAPMMTAVVKVKEEDAATLQPSSVALLPQQHQLQAAPNMAALPSFETLKGAASPWRSVVKEEFEVKPTRGMSEAGVQTAKVALTRRVDVDGGLTNASVGGGTKVVLMRDVQGSLQPLTKAELAMLNPNDLAISLGQLVGNAGGTQAVVVSGPRMMSSGSQSELQKKVVHIPTSLAARPQTLVSVQRAKVSHTNFPGARIVQASQVPQVPTRVQLGTSNMNAGVQQRMPSSPSEDLPSRPLLPPSPPHMPPIPSPEDAFISSLDFLLQPEHKETVKPDTAPDQGPGGDSVMEPVIGDDDVCGGDVLNPALAAATANKAAVAVRKRRPSKSPTSPKGVTTAGSIPFKRRR
ncbi:unnamed protein product [Notodromas monacha]|uniref:Uncharacterized protein n=1 Tax=Notodromas monacha TaxID=399045 RepID=A0A7R9GGZ5_9CRUS|nr:unnamed protein product [Notodromas monacha]CAG0920384.1 unnamed protein product [Notodromas monacha]